MGADHLGALLVDGAVKFFEVNGIDPGVNSDNPLAFPLKLSFSQDTADFSVTPTDVTEIPYSVPEPSTVALLVAVLLATVVFRRRSVIG